MNSFLNYLIEVNLVLTVLTVLYFIFLSKENDFRFKRYLLVFGVLIALIGPALNVSLFSFESLPTSQEIGTIILPELSIGEGNATATTPSSLFSLELLYWVGLVIVAQLFIFQLLQIAWFLKSGNVTIDRQGAVFYINTNGTLPTFTFLNLLFFDNSIEMSERDQNQIIEHEKEHIRQLHSLDIIVFEITKIVCWFNPVIWVLKKEITDLHEYLADDKIIKTTDAQQYSSLLASMALNQAQLAIGHHFNKSKTIKRINMMKTKKRNVQGWKTAIIIPVLALVAFMVSCNDEVMQDVNEVMTTATQMEVPASLEMDFAELQKKYPKADLIYMEVDGASEEAVKNLKDIDPSTIAWVNVDKEADKISLFVNKNGALSNYTQNPEMEGAFTVVDEPAQVEGGFDTFYGQLAEQLQYPKQARKEGIEGRVFIQFIVTDNGTVKDAKVIKGIGGGCDQAALEAFNAVNSTWSVPKQAGKAVAQKIVLPISFKLPPKDEAEG